MIDAECAESKEKSNFRFSNFYFSSYGHFSVIFVTSSNQSLMNFSDSFKNKIREFFSIFFILFSTLLIIHKTHIINALGEGGGVCISFLGKVLISSCCYLLFAYISLQLKSTEEGNYWLKLKKWFLKFRWV